MGLPDKSALKMLQKRGDAQVDPLLEELMKDHGELALAGLLEVMFRWMPGQPFRPDPANLPAALIAAATEFLEHDDVLGGAFGARPVDWDRIRRAQDFYDLHKPLGMLILGCGSLPACYSFPGVAMVLMGSGRLSVQVRSRLVETSSFLAEVMKPGSLGAGGQFKGNQWIRKVRLMHGLMRRLLLADATRFEDRAEDTAVNFLLRFDWSGRATKEDFPIDQVELGFVLLTFSWMVIRGLRILWVGMSSTQRDDYIYAWSVIGHGLGIEPVMRPETASEAEALFDLLREDYEQGTEEGRLLVAALVVYLIFRLRQGIREMLPPWLLRFLAAHFRRFGSGCLESLARTFVRVFTGADTANRPALSLVPASRSPSTGPGAIALNWTSGPR